VAGGCRWLGRGARTTDGIEVPLVAYRLSAVVMERMVAGLATRRHVAAAEPVGQAVAQAATATSRSAISRRFIAATKTALAELLDRDLSTMNIKVLMVDGEHVAEHLAVVALAITADGTKVPVGLWEGPPPQRLRQMTGHRSRPPLG
jgi:hypothetical protein